MSCLATLEASAESDAILRLRGLEDANSVTIDDADITVTVEHDGETLLDSETMTADGGGDYHLNIGYDIGWKALKLYSLTIVAKKNGVQHTWYETVKVTRDE